MAYRDGNRSRDQQYGQQRICPSKYNNQPNNGSNNGNTGYYGGQQQPYRDDGYAARDNRAPRYDDDYDGRTTPRDEREQRDRGSSDRGRDRDRDSRGSSGYVDRDRDYNRKRGGSRTSEWDDHSNKRTKQGNANSHQTMPGGPPTGMAAPGMAMAGDPRAMAGMPPRSGQQQQQHLPPPPPNANTTTHGRGQPHARAMVPAAPSPVTMAHGPTLDSLKAMVRRLTAEKEEQAKETQPLKDKMKTLEGKVASATILRQKEVAKKVAELNKKFKASEEKHKSTIAALTKAAELLASDLKTLKEAAAKAVVKEKATEATEKQLRQQVSELQGQLRGGGRGFSPMGGDGGRDRRGGGDYSGYQGDYRNDYPGYRDDYPPAAYDSRGGGGYAREGGGRSEPYTAPPRDATYYEGGQGDYRR